MARSGASQARGGRACACGCSWDHFNGFFDRAQEAAVKLQLEGKTIESIAFEAWAESDCDYAGCGEASTDVYIEIIYSWPKTQEELDAEILAEELRRLGAEKRKKEREALKLQRAEESAYDTIQQLLKKHPNLKEKL